MLQDHITLLFLFQLLIEINCQKTPFVLKQRSDHTATFIDNKLYIFGGYTPDNYDGRDFFYIDFSVPFNTQNLLVKDLSSSVSNTMPSQSNAGAAKGGANNDTLFICGGDITGELVYTFNPQDNSWDIPKTTGEAPIYLIFGSTGAIDYNGRMYFWDEFSSNFNILDTINLIWRKGISIGAAPKVGYGVASTVLPGNKIMYMGGNFDISELMNQVYIYDTVSNIWSTQTTSGTVPTNRNGLTAVLGLDGQRVIIFGGSANAYTDLTENPLYELSLTNFEWRIPKTTGQTPKSRVSHRANVIKNYMVISFGILDNDILLLEISNVNEYIWTYEFYPSPHIVVPTTPTISPQQSLNSPNYTANITFIIVGTLFGFALFIFLLYIWNKRRIKNNKIKKNVNGQGRETVGSLSNKNVYNHGQEIVESSSNNIYNHGQEIVESPSNENIYNHGQEILESPSNNIYNHGQEIVESPSSNENIYNHGQEIVESPSNENIFNHGQEIIQPLTHGQESIQIANDKKVSLQYVQELEQEIEDLRQLILQNNK